MGDDMARNACGYIFLDDEKVSRIKESLKAKDPINRMAETFRVLCDSTRLKIVLALEFEELCVCDIASARLVASSSVSAHSVGLGPAPALLARPRLNLIPGHTCEQISNCSC